MPKMDMEFEAFACINIAFKQVKSGPKMGQLSIFICPKFHQQKGISIFFWVLKMRMFLSSWIFSALKERHNFKVAPQSQKLL